MRIAALRAASRSALVVAVGIGLCHGVARSQTYETSDYLRDRGPGIQTSMFATYIQKGELLIYPFFEYYLDNSLEYKPAEMGFGLAQDFWGRYRASEGLLYFAYGLTDWAAIEFEAAVIRAKQEKAADDPSPTPAVIKESGSGDVEGQLRLRLLKEDARRPEVFSFFEAVSPQQRDKRLIGTPDWEFKLGVGLIKGYSWGTMAFRAAAEYTRAEKKYESGEYALEYVKRLSRLWRVYLGIEGVEDEIALITEAQWHFTDFAYLKLNSGVGLTKKATDWAPEVGVMFRIPLQRR